MFTWKTHCGLKFHLGQFDWSEICTEVSFNPPEVMWTLIMELLCIEVKFYPEVNSQTGLSSLRVSCKRALRAIIQWLNELCFATVVLNLKTFLTIDFNKEFNNKFSIRISSLNVTKSVVSCGFGNIYWSNPQWKASFFVQWKISSTCAGQMLCINYSNLEERRHMSKLYMLATGHLFLEYGLGN